MHYRRMYDDTDMLYAYDLDGAKSDVVVQIEKVYGGELTGQKGRKTKKPFVKFFGKEKKLALNKTNGKAIASMYGSDTENWVGKYIALYVTTTEFDGEERECIRVRNRQPSSPQQRGRAGGNSDRRSGKEQPNQLQEQIRDQMASGGTVARPTDDDDGDGSHDDAGAGATE